MLSSIPDSEAYTKITSDYLTIFIIIKVTVTFYISLIVSDPQFSEFDSLRRHTSVLAYD